MNPKQTQHQTNQTKSQASSSQAQGSSFKTPLHYTIKITPLQFTTIIPNNHNHNHNHGRDNDDNGRKRGRKGKGRHKIYTSRDWNWTLLYSGAERIRSNFDININSDINIEIIRSTRRTRRTFCKDRSIPATTTIRTARTPTTTTTTGKTTGRGWKRIGTLADWRFGHGPRHMARWGGGQ